MTAPIAAPGAAVPLALYNQALDRMLEVARELGAKEERARIASIMNAPEARALPLLAWRLAETNQVEIDPARQALAIAVAESAFAAVAAPEGAALLH